jgi:hypothetical protein
LTWRSDSETFTEEKVAAALSDWKRGARALGTESTLSLLLLSIAATLGGMDGFIVALAVVAFVAVVRRGYSNRIADNFTDVLDHGQTSHCRVRFGEDPRNGEPVAFVTTITGERIGTFRLLVHDAQVEQLISSADSEYEVVTRHAHLDGKMYILISAGKQLLCGIAVD